MLKPYCSTCGSEENLGVISRYKLKSGELRIQYGCRPCNANRHRTWYQRNGVLQQVSNKKYEAANPERRKAWRAANSIPLEPCQVCAATEKVHRHHDDPNKPLDVMFLCPLHHKARHRELRALAV